jgi:hypothetical protein
LQAGGHRFDPGTLHFLGLRDLQEFYTPLGSTILRSGRRVAVLVHLLSIDWYVTGIDVTAPVDLASGEFPAPWTRKARVLAKAI